MPKLEPVIVALEAQSGSHAAAWRGEPDRVCFIEIDVAGGRPPPREISEAFYWSGAIAAAAHLSLLVAFYPFAAESPQSGGAGRYLEAVSVSLVPSNVLETKVDLPTDTGGGRSAEISATDGDAAPKDSNGELAPQPVQEPPAPPRAIADEALPAEKKPQPKSAEPAQGGATARAISDAPMRAASASASQGEIDRYAVRVRAALARNKPAGSRRGGNVTIVFTIGLDGRAANVHVTESSASRSLTRAVERAVTRVAFPPPPAGMSNKQRTYVVPFNFR